MPNDLETRLREVLDQMPGATIKGLEFTRNNTLVPQLARALEAGERATSGVTSWETRCRLFRDAFIATLKEKR
jgi:hypothetical protein